MFNGSSSASFCRWTKLWSSPTGCAFIVNCSFNQMGSNKEGQGLFWRWMDACLASACGVDLFEYGDMSTAFEYGDFLSTAICHW